MPYIDQTMSKSRKPVCYIQSHKIRLLYKVATALTNWFFITEMECVYCAVRTGSLTVM